MAHSLPEAIANGVFAARKPILAAFALLTLFMGHAALQLRMEAAFEKFLPLKHPYMLTFVQYQQEFGGANRLLIALEAKEGDIFTPQLFETLKQVTDEVFFLPGVARPQVTSVFTPNVRFIEIVEDGFAGGNVIPDDFEPTEEGFARVRENIIKSGQVGRLVANDFSAAMVSAQLMEVDPKSGKRLDYIEVAHRLENEIRAKYESDTVGVRIIGFAKLVGDIADGAAAVVAFLAIAVLLTPLLVYIYSRSVRLTAVPVLCSLVAVIWQMGLLTLLGYGLHPMSILVPFFVFAIGVSHGVQMINAQAAEISEGADSLTAARRSFRRLLVPGGIALASDTIGFLTILLIRIEIIQDLGISASLGVAAVILTNLFLLPILLSYVGLGRGYRERLTRSAPRKMKVWKALARLAKPKVALVSIGCAVILLGFGLNEASKLKIGDLHPGVAELREDSRYNRDSFAITDKFSIGVDVITTIVETGPDACIDFEVMDTIDRFQWHIENVDGVQSTIALPTLAKINNAGWNEGSLKWRVLPRNPQVMVGAVSPVDTATGLLNADCSVMPVLIFTADHKADTIERVTDAVKAFAAVHDSEKHTFRLATGNVGVIGAANEAVRAAQVPILLYVYAAITVLCLVTFRSWRATFCILTPLCLVSILVYALMSLLEIGLKVATLPVVALGIGIGVDYGIYIFSRLKSFTDAGMDLEQAYFQTLRVTGSAVLVTGLTLAICVSSWVFSPLKFQADMGVLLTFMFLVNMLGAIFLLPALAVWLERLIPTQPRPA